MKLFALFPNLVLTEPRTAAGVDFIPQAVAKGSLPRALAVIEAADAAERQAAERCLTVLSAHLMTAALLRGQPVLPTCRHIRWCQGDLPKEEASFGFPLSFGFLADCLPDDTEPTAQTLAFFAKYLRDSDPAVQAVALYNAFGTLPAGFDAIGGDLNLPEEQEFIRALATHIKAVREAEDDDSGKPRQPVPSVDAATLALLEQVYLRALLTCYPYLGRGPWQAT